MKKNYCTEEKRHYKLYKAKSRWLVAAITTSGLVLLATAPASQAQADSVDEVTVTQTTNNQVTTNSQNADTEQTTNQVQTNTQTATANQTENVATSADVNTSNNRKRPRQG
ncbi:KxYKxGKxW signal peptide domain-containing protein [Ligilactobacillus equi]|uniref:KxYKxGKxW signal peptide domain-containing protein n=1 Tax=Ligilactobacillus equi TaxID=137357 RepID=UPI000ADE8094|nr:KxYKxGKxW signal peptide domain-containing protein [Ligilactobacillus equi]